MNTYDEQRAFFLKHWPELRERLQTGGVPAMVSYIYAHEDPLERRVLFVFSRQGMNGRDAEFENGIEIPSLDVLVEFADAGIAEMLAQAQLETDQELRNRRIDSANVISYNLGADLADCWPNERLSPTNAHHQRGKRAGEDCIRWRTELNKPPAPRSTAYWLRGVHELALGELAAAQADWQEARRYAGLDAQASSQPTEPSADAGFSILLAHGNLALLDILRGIEGSEARFEQVLGLFKQQLSSSDPEKAEDAGWGIAQLEVLHGKYARRKPAG